jgi:hypothetical protein
VKGNDGEGLGSNAAGRGGEGLQASGARGEGGVGRWCRTRIVGD